MKIQKSVDMSKVKVNDSFWTPLQNLVMDTVIPYQYEILEDRVEGAAKSHAIENFRIAAGEAEGEFYGMVFQDSDVAKWLEAVAYSLALRPDPELEKKADEVIRLIGKAQAPDGYLDTRFLIKDQDKKWMNLQDWHELYCNGHMIEAAVAFHEALGKDELLNVLCKTADLICNRFGKGKVRGYPGHQEIELALLRLYRATGREQYRDTALYFLNERGTQPDYLEEESKKDENIRYMQVKLSRHYGQTHMPVREQSEAVGHAVRAGYMYTAMADMASITGDQELAAACRRLWENIVTKKMYLTGGLGSTANGEAYSDAPYELPNDLIYAETCASVAMAFFARRMLELEVRGEYADILEKELYNGALSGMQIDGKRFFYVNPLEVVPGVSGVLREYKHVLPKRPAWYACACCPPNVARLLVSLGGYAWGEGNGKIYAHTYLGGEASFETAGGVTIACETNYPFGGEVSYTVKTGGEKKEFTFAIHIPSWCRGWNFRLSREGVTSKMIDGYLYLTREWEDGDTVSLNLPLEAVRVWANPKVRADSGCAALMRGPIVYCFEEADNGPDLMELRMPRESEITEVPAEFPGFGKICALEVEGLRLRGNDSLYSTEPFAAEPALLRAIPYFLWGNREAGGMRVWLNEQA
ncbi:MAG: glycoside hydrolase family 127 protein [Clostridia bacterium]|nr:glycoside hydrolase family 127 protein [Clostridia bacterium]